ncbi:MAG: sugar ABC transporter permease [Candidatus Izemoplasmatales bacterium]|nr:sugar ABC transporter permease [Candidatus Izemoplasmatales bacterium]MDY0372902.1 sugar ABC transporter permease [Candidatus Izemoplasmatales bacterium]
MKKLRQFFENGWEKLRQSHRKFQEKIWFPFEKKVGLRWLKDKLRQIPNKIKHAIYGILFISPWLIGLGVLGVPLLVRSIRMALSDKYYFITGQGWRIIGEWYHFTQFKRIFSDEPWHLEQILATLQDIALVIPLVVVFALILAMMLNQKIKGRAIFRTIFFIPVILLSGNMVSNFQSGGLLTVPAILSGQISGVMTEFFPEVFSEVILLAFGKIVLILWLSGVQILIFLAGLQKLDPALYEAAEIDGASMWEMFWKITLPALMPLMYINIIYTTVIYANLSNNPLNVIINVTSDEWGSLGGTLTDEVNYGRAYSAALSWVLFAIELVVIGGYSLIVKLASKRYE